MSRKCQRNNQRRLIKEYIYIERERQTDRQTKEIRSIAIAEEKGRERFWLFNVEKVSEKQSKKADKRIYIYIYI